MSTHPKIEIVKNFAHAVDAGSFAIESLCFA
jgi:hypothetical protein